MLVDKLIDIAIRPLEVNETVQDALDRIQDQLLQHVVIVENDKLRAILSEDQLLENDPSAKILSLVEFLPAPVSLVENSGEVQAFRLMSEHQIELLPVVRQDFTLVGCVSMRKAFFRLCKDFAPPANGGIIVLRVHPLNYQLSQIAQITESGDARILSLHTKSGGDNALLITIMTDKEDLDGVVQTFRRYEYDVVGTFYRSIDQVRLQERYDSLMRYLNT